MNYYKNLDGLKNKNMNFILTEQMYQAIVMICAKCPDVVFGGSLALNAVGLLNRPIHDLDVFVSYDSSLASNGFLNIERDDGSLSGIMSDTVTDINGNKIQRTSISVNGINVCCFKVDTALLEHSTYNLNGTIIKIQNVNHAIAAKIQYSAHNSKHKVDLVDIYTKLGSILN